MNTLDRKRQRERLLVEGMIALYCRKHHGCGAPCPQCAALRSYAAERIERCPHMAQKTFCSACKAHCYRTEMREGMRRVMRYAGPRMLFCHPLVTVRHLLLGKVGR